MERSMDSLKKHSALQRCIDRVRKQQPDQFELYFYRSTSLQIDARNQKIETLSRDQDVGMALRILKDGQAGFSYSTSLEPKSLDETVKKAFAIAQVMDPDPDVEFHRFGRSVYPTTDSVDQEGLARSMDEKVNMALTLEQLCKKADARVVNVRNSEISESLNEVLMVDTDGEVIEERSTHYGATVVCKAVEGEQGQTGYDFHNTHVFSRLNLPQVAEQAAQMATLLLGAREAPTMNCPAILKNHVVSQMLSFLSSSFSSEAMIKGRSMLSGQVGKKVFSKAVHIIDDALLSDGYGTRAFDAEGVPSRKTVLVEGGDFQQELFDRYHAKKAGRESTASAVRGMTSPPSIGFSNLYLKKGKKDFKQLLDGIKKGIYLTDLMGVHTANPVTGDFSLGASGIMIEKGELTYPVKGFAVAGNILEVFRRMTDISNDIRFFGKVGSPSVRISDISVGGE